MNLVAHSLRLILSSCHIDSFEHDIYQMSFSYEILSFTRIRNLLFFLKGRENRDFCIASHCCQFDVNGQCVFCMFPTSEDS